MKYFSIISFILLLFLTFIESSYFRYVGNKREVVGVFVEDASEKSLTVDTQEILNEESVRSLARRTVNVLLNYRPGQALSHMEENEISSVFISEDSFKNFEGRFLYWSDREFRNNNISIKESIVTSESLIPVPMTGGMRMWGYTASVPMVNRGVGGTGKTILSIKMQIVYAGTEVGIGIYDIKLYN
tara:strand:- start:4872 stop:5429 length:558 start_codon:yes stop_codon:yes gene_type:complete